MKGRKHRKNGGDVESAKSGTKEYEQDLRDKPESRVNAKKITAAAEERKRGGRAKKHVGEVKGEHCKPHAGRKARKSGGRAGSNMNPLSSAHAGTPAKGRHTVDID